MDGPFGVAALTSIRKHPRFRDAVEQYARSRVEQFRRLDAALRWATTDLGRSTLSRATVVLHRRPEGLTANALLESARTLGLCSRGRVLAYLDGAQLRGLLSISAGDGYWTDRPVQVSPALCGQVEDTARNLLAAVDLLEPEAPETANGEQRLQGLLAAMAALPTTDPAVLSVLPVGIRQFMEHDGALRILDELIVRQRSERARLLEAVRFSQLSLARASGVSRAQVKRLLASAQPEGFVMVGDGELDFAPAFSDAAELRFALIFRVAQLAASLAASRG